MQKNHNTAADQILTQVNSYCKKFLDKEYTDICSKVFHDLLEENPTVFDRGREGIWAAAIVWAVGSVNFLYDKSFEPYASLADVCIYFNQNKSSVGQKSAKIRKLLNIDQLNPEYQTSTHLSDFLNSLVVTPDGIIVPSNLFEEDDIEKPVSDERKEYLLALRSSKSINNAALYQLEYLLKTILPKESRFIEIEKEQARTVLITFFGTMADIETIDDKLKSSGFEIVNIYYEGPE
ncbi:MAG: hypothetical protein JW965_05845 [Bacteroidales bacterium]|nr:hypothetical protein [Bacteroidales bacterium]